MNDTRPFSPLRGLRHDGIADGVRCLTPALDAAALSMPDLGSAQA